MTTTLPPMPQPVFRRTRGKRIRTTTPATTALTRRPTLPRTTMTRLPKFRPSIPIRTFPTRFLAFTTPTPFTSSFLPETRSRHTQTPSTLPFLPETRSRHTQMELKSQTKRVENSRELNTVGTEPLSSTSKTPKITFSSTSGPEPPPSSISPSSSEIQNSNSKGPAQPPGFIPPNDAVVDKLNNAIDFMAIAKRMRLRRRRLSFIRRFAAQTRSKAAVS
uniref:Uncharacterized protein n=1 Tax=Acrobeloides nanus TaxID=290746 RepID=A0A914CG21_9BILA